MIMATLYDHQNPHGKLFKGEDEIIKALNDGWVEAPGLVKEINLEKVEGKIAILDAEISKLETKPVVVSNKIKMQTTKLINMRKKGRPRKGG